MPLADDLRALGDRTTGEPIAAYDYYHDSLKVWDHIFDLPDKAAITDSIVTRELIEVAYQKPSAWFAYLEEKAKPGYPPADEVDRIAESKATRDLLTHNRG